MVRTTSPTRSQVTDSQPVLVGKRNASPCGVAVTRSLKRRAIETAGVGYVLGSVDPALVLVTAPRSRAPVDGHGTPVVLSHRLRRRLQRPMRHDPVTRALGPAPPRVG